MFAVNFLTSYIKRSWYFEIKDFPSFIILYYFFFNRVLKNVCLFFFFTATSLFFKVFHFLISKNIIKLKKCIELHLLEVEVNYDGQNFDIITIQFLQRLYSKSVLSIFLLTSGTMWQCVVSRCCWGKTLNITVFKVRTGESSSAAQVRRRCSDCASSRTRWLSSSLRAIRVAYGGHSLRLGTALIWTLKPYIYMVSNTP